ncbi:hypothetical protein C8Q77DRAFT_413333 [Trametes polyzona]|nr:hypothetical protein C8Q77DRAFT_413333 [Trametes polyzona]
MSPQRRNMGWRKPVPKLSPDPSISSSQRPSRSALRRLSLTIVNKDVPPLPTDWRESIETALKREKRHAVYLSPPSTRPPSPPPKDDTCSRPESLALTLVEELHDAVTTCSGPRHDGHGIGDGDDSQPIQCVQRTQASPVVLPRRPSQKSLPQIYRPPTPPLPAEHPKLRPTAAARSSTSSESVANTLYSGLVAAERPKASTSSTKLYAEKAPEASRPAEAREARRRCRSAAATSMLPEKPLQPAHGGSPCAYRASAMSASTAGNRSSSGRSYCPSDVCFGVWYALKGWGLHVRAKMSHAGRY